MFKWRPSVSLGIQLQAPLTRAYLKPQVQTFNEAMSKAWIPVDWIFETITNYYKFVDFKSNWEYKPGLDNLLRVWNPPECSHLPVSEFRFRLFQS